MNRLAIILMCFFTVMPSFAAGEAKSVKIALFHYYPFLLKDSPEKGYAFDVTKHIFEKAGYSVEEKFLPLSRAITAAENKKYDIVLGLNHTHSKKLAFSKTPITSLKFYIWSRQALDWNYESGESLKKVNIVSVSGFNYSTADPEYQNYIDTKAKNVKMLTGHEAIERAFQMVESGRADIFCLDIDQATTILKSMGKIDKFKSVGQLKDLYLGYLGVSIDHPQKNQIIDVFENGMNEIMETGEANRIVETYVKNYGLKHIPFKQPGQGQ